MAEPLVWPEDSLLDAVALAQAVRSGDAEAVSMVVHTSDWHAVMLSLARLVAQAADESACCDGHFRLWALHVLDQGRPEG